MRTGLCARGPAVDSRTSSVGRSTTSRSSVRHGARPPAARTALNEGDYGAGTPLIRDGASERNVYHSWAGDPALIMDLRASGGTLSPRSSR